MKCPACDTEMDEHLRHGVRIDHCPACGGVWLDKGELDALIAALRPSVVLSDPEPAPARPVPKPQPAPSRERVESPRPAPKPARESSRSGKSQRNPGSAHRYGRTYSNRARLKDILEEIFDFD